MRERGEDPGDRAGPADDLGLLAWLWALACTPVCCLRGCDPVIGWVEVDVLVDLDPPRWAVVQRPAPVCRRCRDLFG